MLRKKIRALTNKLVKKRRVSIFRFNKRYFRRRLFGRRSKWANKKHIWSCYALFTRKWNDSAANNEAGCMENMPERAALVSKG